MFFCKIFLFQTEVGSKKINQLYRYIKQIKQFIKITGYVIYTLGLKSLGNCIDIHVREVGTVNYYTWMGRFMVI